VPLNHVALTVSDRERSAAFYGRHFGLTERIHDDGHLLILGSREGSLVALSEGAVPDSLPPTNHFGFQLGWTVMAIDRVTRRWAVAQACRQLDAAEDAYARLYAGA
jgi:catechol 2,3-dioxygenase-like lactoylglutathione lyase family enzyme